MNTKWHLDVLYTGFDDPAYESDIQKAQEAYEALRAAVQEVKEVEEKGIQEVVEAKASRIENILLCQEEIAGIMAKTGNYIGLRQAVNTKDGQNMAQMARLMRLDAEYTEDNAAAQKILGSIEDIDVLAKESETIRDYEALLKELKKQYSHMLPDEVESMIASMDMTGGSAWGQLQSFLSSTLKVDYRDEVITLSHSAASKEVFAVGAVNAAVFLAGQKPGMYDMSALMEQTA